MTIDILYSYNIKLTKEEKIEIDKQTRKNKFDLKFAVFFPFSSLILQISSFSINIFYLQQILKDL